MTPSTGLRFGIALAAVVVAAGSTTLFRPGYSPDEEFTLFAVRGIHAHGLPLLPSGLLYDRGLLYSYLSSLAAAVTGLELPAFRALSLLSSASALALGYALVRKAASPAAAALAVVLVATSVPFWAVATTGRFYAPFLLTCVAVLAAVARIRPRETGTSGGQARRSAAVFFTRAPDLRDKPARTRRYQSAPDPTWLVLGLLAYLSRLTHELAFTLMAIPAAGLFLSWAEGRASAPSASSVSSASSAAPLRPWLLVSLALAAGLVAAQAVSMGLHFVMPASEGGGSTMIERFFLWQVLNLFERPVGAPLGIVCAALIVAWLLVPARAAFHLILALCGAAIVTAIAAAHAARTAPLSVPLVQGAVAGSLAYPLDMFWNLAGANPVMVCLAMALLVARLCGAGGEWPAGERAAHLGWVGWVLWFGVIESGITINYLLLPTVCMLAAIGIDLVAVGQHAAAIWPGPRGQVMRAGLAGAALLVTADQWSGTGSLRQRLTAARPTIDVAGIDGIRQGLQPIDRIACTDELACLVLVGRVDAWLALDDYVRARFLVMRGRQGVGVYAGAPAAFGPGELFEPGPDGIAPARVIAVDVFKDYPVGSSRTWLPRAIDADGLQFRTLLLTPQARVVEVMRP